MLKTCISLKSKRELRNRAKHKVTYALVFSFAQLNIVDLLWQYRPAMTATKSISYRVYWPLKCPHEVPNLIAFLIIFIFCSLFLNGFFLFFLFFLVFFPSYVHSKELCIAFLIIKPVYIFHYWIHIFIKQIFQKVWSNRKK